MTIQLDLASTTGQVLNSDPANSIETQIVKVGFSGPTTAPTLVTAANPFPVTIISGAGSGGTAITDNATFTRGTTSETPVGGIAETSAPSLTTGHAAALSLNLSGALRVDGSGVTQPVSGTFWQATQPVSLASQPLPTGASTSAKQPALGTSGAASADVITVQGVSGMTPVVTSVTGSVAVTGTFYPATQPVSGTFWQATQPVSVGTLPLPTGAATAANQPGIGTAGVPNANVMTVQGIASMTALKVDGSGVTQPISGTVTANLSSVGGLALDTSVNGLLIAQGSSTAGQKGTLILGGVTTSPPTYTTGQSAPISITTGGALRVAIVSGAGSGGTAIQDGTSFTRGTTSETPIGGVAETSAPSLTTGNAAALSLTLAGALRVDGSAVTQPVSGTFYPATQAISAVSLPLPTGASTAAKQPALGTAGTASADVISVQGVASMTALKVDGSAVIQPVSGTITANVGTTNGLALDTSVNGLLLAQGSTTSGQKGPLTQAAVSTASPTYTNAQTAPLSMTTGGALRVAITSGAGSGGTSIQDGLSFTRGTTSETPVGGVVETSAPTLTAGDAGALSLTTAGALRVDGSAVTQPVSAASLPLPTGAATAANQPGFGSAGSANAHVVSVQGIASMTPILVNGSGVTQPVSGTFWQATQPVSAASLPLPAGAATAANQPGIGTAGTANANVLTIQGISGMTAVKVDGSAVTQPVSGTVTSNIGTTNGLALDTSVNGILVAQGSTTSGQKGGLTLGAVTTSNPSYTSGQTAALSLDANGNLRTVSSGVTGGTSIADGATFTRGTTTETPAGGVAETAAPTLTNGKAAALSLNTSGGLRVDGSAVTQPVSAASLPLPTGASTAAKQPALGTAGTPSADVITIQGATSMTALTVVGGISNQASAGATKLLLVGGVYNSAGNTLTSGQVGQLQMDSASNVMVNMAAGGVPGFQDSGGFTAATTQGLMIMAVANDTIAALTSGDAGGIRCTLDRQLLVAPGASPSGGWTPYTLVAGTTPGTILIKGSAGQIGGMQCTNSGSNWAWLKIWNVASTGAVTLGTTAATQSIGIPPGGGFVVSVPKYFSAGIVIGVTGGAALADDTAVGAANTVSINIDWK